LQIDLRYANGGGDFVIETLGVVPFTVSGSVLAPVAAPASTMGGLAILTILMVLAALLAFRARRSDVFFILLVVVPLCTRAQSTPDDTVIELLLTTAPGTPTPAQLVNYYRKPIGSFPLASLATMPPSAVYYLLPNRAAGNFLLSLQQNPSSARAKLERMMLLRYAPGTNMAPILGALHGDSSVEAAASPIVMETSSVGLDSFSVMGTDPYASVDQYGRDTLNVDAAWQVAGGYALIADIDTGLYTRPTWTATDCPTASSTLSAPVLRARTRTAMASTTASSFRWPAFPSATPAPVALVDFTAARTSSSATGSSKAADQRI
jgi:hypothetical protein